MKAIFKRIKKSVVLTVATIVLLTAVVGGSLAWLIDQTGIITNRFNAPKVDIDIEEDIKDLTKDKVAIKNNSDIDVYVRVAIVATWKDKDGNVYPEKPLLGTDYTWTQKYSYDGIVGVDDCSWYEYGGFYYYFDFVNHKFKALKPNQTTNSLIESVVQTGSRTPEGYSLSVEIISQAIQANPEDVIEDTWGVRVSALGLIETVGLLDGDNINGMDIPGGGI